MRKYMVMFLSVMAVLAFAVSSFALHAVPDNYEYTPQIVKSSKAQLDINGHIRIRGRASDNTTDFRDKKNGLNDDSRAYWDQRMRLGIKATVSPKTMGMIEFESGNYDDKDSYAWADPNTFPSHAKGMYAGGADNSKRGTIHLRQAYIAHQGDRVGNMRSGFKAGHMLMALGNGIFFNHGQFGDDAIVLWLSPADGMEISLNAIKLSEGASVIVSDDADAYVATFAGAAGPANISADLTYINDNGKNLDFYNLGARADFAAGPAKIKADIELQSGKMKKFKTSGNDMKFSGFAAVLAADIKAGPVTVGVEGGYGSGDKIGTKDKFEGFINSLSDGQKFTYLYDQFTRTAAQSMSSSGTTSSTYANTGGTGITNTTYIGVGVDAKPTSDIGVSADLWWLAASKKVAEKSTTTSDKKDIGVEIDGKFTYQLDTNIVYYIEGGYLFAGDFYKNVTMDNKSPDDPWSLRHGLVLTF